VDAKFINPFIHGTVETMRKLAFMDIQPGKLYMKEGGVAAGDVSGIIGITGYAVGSLAISFVEADICDIVSSMRGDLHTAVDGEVFDAVREITQTILAVAITSLEREGMKVYGALPTVVYGKNHSIESILDSTCLSIPFSMGKGAFVVDISIKSAATGAATAMVEPVAQPRAPAIKTAVSAVKPDAENVPSEMDRKDLLKKQLTEATVMREELMKQLAEKPFMEISQRKKFKQTIPVFDAKIRRLKLDIATLEMMAKISSDELENPTIVPHYQHYDSNKKL